VRKGTRLLDITISHTNPAVAKAVADAIAIEYQAELTGARSDDRSSSEDILTKESDKARNLLQTAQNAFANYQRALTTLKELEDKERIVAELSRRYLPKHPRLLAANGELDGLQQKFLLEFEAARSSAADKGYWQDHAEEWSDAAEGDMVNKLLVARRLLLARASVLNSEITSQTNVFNSILVRIQETGINSKATESEMEISSLSQLPGAPSSPKSSQVIGAGAMSGMMLGILIALLFVKLDNKFHTVAQIERETQLPILAAVSDIQPQVLESVAKQKKVDLNLVHPARQKWDKRIVFREGVSATTFAEMFRVLRASVSLLGDEKKRKITLFSSALPGEGKSLISSNFALAAAQSGKHTVLVDLDLRKPSIHKNFGLKRDSHPVGTTEVLAGQAKLEDAIFTHTGDDRLHLVLCGKQAPNPGELLNATALEEMLDQLSQEYDIVVVDSAPLLAVPDTRLIIPLVDNFCLVSRAEYVPKGAVRRALELLQHDGQSPAGIVFNGFTEKRRLIGQNYSYGNYQTNKYGRAYRYGYGSYGAYGSEDS